MSVRGSSVLSVPGHSSSDQVGKRMHRTMLKYLSGTQPFAEFRPSSDPFGKPRHIFSDKQQRYLKQRWAQLTVGLYRMPGGLGRVLWLRFAFQSLLEAERLNKGERGLRTFHAFNIGASIITNTILGVPPKKHHSHY